jgi:hypothetical protein
MVAFLLDRGADMDKVDIGGFTWTAHSVHREYYEIAAYLLQRGARADVLTYEDLNIWDLLGNSFSNLTLKEESGVVAIMRNLLVSTVPLSEEEEAYLFLDQDLPSTIRSVLSDGLQLRRRIGPYICHRQTFIEMLFVKLMPDVIELIFSFEGPLTTEEIWATGLVTP